MTAPAIYGLDIETDTSVDGLDPAVSPVVTVALATGAGEETFVGPERSILAAQHGPPNWCRSRGRSSTR